MNIYLFNVLRSSYCRTVFIISFILSYFLIPEKVFVGWYSVLAILFMITFSLVLTCFVRAIKERIIHRGKNKHSLFGLLAAIFGISAFQVCGIGAPVCSATMGAWLLSIFFPSFLISFLSEYGVLIILFSIFFQLTSLYFMKCYQKVLQS